MTVERQNAGFTLIELMVALAILAIIVAVAIPAYTNQVVKTNRSEAKTILSQTAQAFERCYSRFGSYDDSNCGAAQSGFYPVESENGWYQIAQPAGGDLDASSFTITATPQGSQATRDTECGSFILQHNGTRSVSTGTDPDDCW